MEPNRIRHFDPLSVPTNEVRRLQQAWQKLQQSAKAGSNQEFRDNPQTLTPEKWQQQLGQAQAKVQERRQRLPKILYPAELPVVERAEEIAALIREHAVVIVGGETGSGKTTQLPKICLDASLGLGLGARGIIAHTQPRRIAARTVAQRIAEELQSPLGDLVGFKVRFSDRTSPNNLIQLVTDGMLLAEIQRDRLLQQYEVIIIDEAHERSLNIDFLLGYLKQLLPQRPDLKIIITSATLDAERLTQHFSQNGQAAPIIQVSGRLYPVEMRYRPVQTPDDDERELEEAIVDAVEELCRVGPGDILIFLPGEREIRETADLLQRAITRNASQSGAYSKLRGAEILPLYARLAVAEQQRIFAPTGNARRIILATNVAETSLTVPGIRFVVDTGLARINRYSVRNKVQLLQIEKIAQAAANQRAGRCGRVAAGVCIRLYDEADFTARPAHTDPEILRSSLAGVILQMTALGLGEVSTFPFVDPPPTKAVADGYQLLQELGAVDGKNCLTATGRALAKLPIDPRLGRILLAAKEEGCLPELLIITAALSVPDVRDFPLDKQAAAREKHARFADERSDFLSLLAIWDFFNEATTSHKSHRKLVEHCRAHFLSYLRLREWRDIHSQLVREVTALGWTVGERYNAKSPLSSEAKTEKSRRPHPAKRSDDKTPETRFYAAIHRALLTGLLGHIGCKLENEESYQGARGIRFALHPASSVNRKGLKWVVVAELVETSRLFGRCIAKIEPEWIEAVAGDRVQKTYYDPRWDSARGEVMANERVALYGLILDGRRRAAYERINLAEAREIFLREGLVAAHLDYLAPEPAETSSAAREAAELALESHLRGQKTRRGLNTPAQGQEKQGQKPMLPWLNAAFWQHNQELLLAAQETMHRLRRQDVSWDVEDLVAAYQPLIPPEIARIATFESWRQQREATNPKALFLSAEALAPNLQQDAQLDYLTLYPESLKIGGNQYALHYRFQPGHPCDGVTITLPLAVINQIPLAALDWLVPGLIREKINCYIKALPKVWRQRLIPVQEYITHFLERQQKQVGQVTLAEALREDLNRQYSAELRQTIALDTWDYLSVDADFPAYLSMNIRVVDFTHATESRQQKKTFELAELAMGRDLRALQEQLGRAAQLTLETAHANQSQPSKHRPLNEATTIPGGQAVQTSAKPTHQAMERTGMTRWECGDLPVTLTVTRQGHRVTAYPALVAEEASVALSLFDTAEAAETQHRQGVLRLLQLELKEVLRHREKPTTFQAIALHLRALGSAESLQKAFSQAVYDRAFLGDDPLPRSAQSFQKQKERARTRLPAVWEAGLHLLNEVAREYQALNQKITTAPPALKRLSQELTGQRDRLIYPGFLQQTPWEQLMHLPRYLQALQRRWQKYPENPERDQKHAAAVREWWQRWQQKMSQEAAAGRSTVELQNFRWWIEELQVSLFAQELKTPFPISYKRLEKRWSEIIR